ncbi:translation initiation factor IF-2 [Candidatus Woesearchaeota archaeon]|nr:translation initiation factor IF-2 [Candidatus Woesearchaeota archaeon]
MKMENIRSPNCVFVGHVDHGKSSILDRIKGSNVVKSEAGAITQKISCTKVDFKRIKRISRGLLEKLNVELTLPGILFIDTPGHAAFTSLRKRGGNISDIAVLVVDISKGFKQQTIEAIEILKHYKTPFIIALNKVDLLTGWQKKDVSLLQSISTQSENVKVNLDAKIYEIVGKLYDYGFNSERFDRIRDFTKEIAIIPVSALTGCGIPELLMIITGLAQKFLEKNLKIDVHKQGKGVVLEVNERKGVGCVLNTILYDGCIKCNDVFLVGGSNGVIKSKVRGLFEDRKPVKESYAASFLEVCGPELKDVSSGMPLLIANKNEDEIKDEIQKQINEVTIDTDKDGIVIKADSVGSLEALIFMLKERNIKIHKSSIGQINKKDVSDAESQDNELNRVILGFNVKKVDSKNVRIVVNDVIYKIVEDFDEYVKEKEKEIEMNKLKSVQRPAKVAFLRNYIFRQSNPAVIGMEVLSGTLKVGMDLIKTDGSRIGEIKSIQENGKGVSEAEKGKQVAVAISGAIVGRQLIEGDVYVSEINEREFRKLKDMKKLLNSDEIALLKEILDIKRKQNELWGI